MQDLNSFTKFVVARLISCRIGDICQENCNASPANILQPPILREELFAMYSMRYARSVK